MPFDLDLSAAQPLLTRVSDCFSPRVADEMLLVAGKQVGVKAEEIVQDNLYPDASGKALPLYYTREYAHPKPDGPTTYMSKFKSLAQQRKVMAMAKQGKFPYKRSGLLGKSILSQADPFGPGVVIVHVGSNLAYAPYVIDKIMQSHYHMGTWTPIQDDVVQALPQLQSVAVNSVTNQVNRRIRGNG